MNQLAEPLSAETRRMGLRATIRLAGEIIANYWPMRTFVHHNPLHGLEHLDFHEAVRRGREVLGGEGYLSHRLFREYHRAGRIRDRHLESALGRRATEEVIELSGRQVSHLAVMRVQLVHDLTPPEASVFEQTLESNPDRRIIALLAERISSHSVGEGNSEEVCETLAESCDRRFGTRILEQINREMIKWCEAFLDEGHATWGMPYREEGFYGAWKLLAAREWSPCGIENTRKKISGLPAHPEDCLIDSLIALGMDPGAWQDYLSRHLAALPGWAGLIKWRAEQDEYEWQRAYPADLVQYLAVRLWYERELVAMAEQEKNGDRSRVQLEQAQASPSESTAHSVSSRNSLRAGWRLAGLAHALGASPALLAQASDETLLTLLRWLDDFPQAQHGCIWLEAFEAAYDEQLIHSLQERGNELTERDDGFSAAAADDQTHPATVRPQAQLVFCIDVRSEPFRRHLEAIGDYETFGFAGFFAVPIRYEGLGRDHATDQFPVIAQAKNLVREIPRTYQGKFLTRHRRREKLVHAGHTLLYDLKENVVTPYVMVESLGWFYSVPFLGKTFYPDCYRKTVEWLRNTLVPPVATTLTVDKLSREQVEEMLAAEQRAITRRALQEKFGDRNLNLSLERLDFLRRRALDDESAGEPSPQARARAITPEEEDAFVEDLRRSYGINQGAAFARMERITRTGFTPTEQAMTVETVLRLMGLTRNFARLIMLCGHGSRTENNPFEAALDCGACGGNPGKPNARVLAIMANRPYVREQLAQRGIEIPQDTYFIAGQHTTTTDDIELFDLEDLPPTHRKDVLQLMHDLEAAGARTSQERCFRFPEIETRLRGRKAKRQVRRRSTDWSQVRPEWGLSRNAAFIIGHRSLTRGVDLDGRVFLHSYDWRQDPDGRFLEVIMTGPQVVAQWINMEHYFSTVDPEIYGSGSKIYHNVAARLAVMSGPQSDVRTGLAEQTVLNGERPFHEAIRLLTIIEAPKEKIAVVIQGQSHLRKLYDNEWLRLIALEPATREFFRYVPRQGWKPIPPHPESTENELLRGGAT